MKYPQTLLLGILLTGISSPLLGENQLHSPDQLLNKTIGINRAALCELKSFTPNFDYAGKTGKIVEVKPDQRIDLPPEVLNNMTPDAIANLERLKTNASYTIEFPDGKRLDTCTSIPLAAVSQYFEMAPGGTPDSGASKSEPTVDPPKRKKNVEYLSEQEFQAAIDGKGADHSVYMWDTGLMAAQGTATPYIVMLMPEAMIGAHVETARKAIKAYVPTERDHENVLTIAAHGYVGKNISEGCVSIDRVVLLSDPAGSVVKEAVETSPKTETWKNAYGAEDTCDYVLAAFNLSDVKAVKAAAKDGEFYVAVFSGSTNTKTYKIKTKHLQKLGLR